MTNRNAEALATVAQAATPSAGAMVTQADAMARFTRDLEQRHAELATRLAGSYRPEYFAGLVLSQVRKMKVADQIAIASTDKGRTSLVTAAYQAAELGLPFLMGRAYLVPYAGEVQMQVGYQGLVDLIVGPETGVTYIEAAVVRAKDDFDYRRGTGGYLRHREYVPEITDATTQADMVYDRGVRTFYWARVVYANGQDRWDVMPYADVEAIRRRARASGSGPWVTDYDEMGKKTVLRRMSKTMPITLKAMEVIDREDQWEGQAAQPVPVQGAGSQQTQLRRQLQDRLGGHDSLLDAQQGEGGADTADPGPAGDVGPDAGRQSHDTAAPDDQPAEDAAPAAAPQQEAAAGGITPRTAATCGATVSDGDHVYTCDLTPRHRGVHSDGQHDWPQA